MNQQNTPEATLVSVEQKDEILKSEIAHLLDMVPSFGKDLTIIRLFNLFKNSSKWAGQATPDAKIVEGIIEIRNKLYGRLPTGPIDAMDLLRLINDHFKQVDSFCEKIKNQATPVKREGEFQWTDELVKEMIYRKLPIPEHYSGNLQKCLDEFKSPVTENTSPPVITLPSTRTPSKESSVLNNISDIVAENLANNKSAKESIEVIEGGHDFTNDAHDFIITIKSRDMNKVALIKESANKILNSTATPSIQSNEAELLELRQWKKEAMEVMPDYQEIAKLLKIPKGQSVHDKIIPGIKKLIEGER